jgi:hypothetical protein
MARSFHVYLTFARLDRQIQPSMFSFCSERIGKSASLAGPDEDLPIPFEQVLNTRPLL